MTDKKNMHVLINNKEVATKAETIAQLLEELALPVTGTAVAVNNRLVPRGEWGDYALQEGVSLVIIKAACGG